MATDSVKLKYVKLGYHYLIKHFFAILLIPLMAAIVLEIVRLGPDRLLAVARSVTELDQIPLLCSIFVVIFVSTVYFMSRPRPVYLVDYACFKTRITHRVPFATFLEHSRIVPFFNEKTIKFQMYVLERSGLGEETALPPTIHYLPPRPTMEATRTEAELVIFDAIDDLFGRTGLKPKDIDILIVNCSLFSPTPSLSAMIINKYKLRSNIRSFNLSGMGCSAGLISIDLARDLLQAHANSNAVVVSTEIITPNYYSGNHRPMVLPNCLFRMGAAAVLLSNRSKEKRRAKYRLLHIVRTHKGADDKAYRCVFQEQDSEGNTGINLSKDFKMAFKHFCIHAGGRAVIYELQKSLQLSADNVEASRMTLHRFGNTSSSSLWYELNYLESKGRMKRGHRVWQIGFGSGFKCNSAVWKCMRTVKTPVDGLWTSSIDWYPVEIPDIVKI